MREGENAGLVKKTRTEPISLSEGNPGRNLRNEDGLRKRSNWVCRRMQRGGQRMAIILARDGRELGIVTVEDILKVMFGEMKL